MIYFLRKVVRKALEISRRVVYHNYFYKPKAACSSTLEIAKKPGEGVDYIALYPRHVSRLDIPEEMYSIYSDYPKHKMVADNPPAFIAVLQEGRIYSDNLESVAVINKNGLLLGDVSFQYTKRTWESVPPGENNIFRQRYFVRPKKLPGTAFSLLSGGGAAIGNYWHWIIDSLAKIHLLKKSGLYKTVNWFLVYNLHPDFILDSLKFLEISPEQVIVMDKHKHVSADRVIVSSPVRGNDKHVPLWACQFLKETYLPKIKQRVNYPFIYISRSDARARHVLNEAAVIRLLDNYGFKVIVLSKLNFEEKIDVFSTAKVVLSPIGAQLTNIVFCKRGTTLIELFPEGFVLPDAVDLAKKGGMNYHYMICKNAKPSKNIANGRQEHLTVDLQALKVLLDKIMAPITQDA